MVESRHMGLKLLRLQYDCDGILSDVLCLPCFLPHI